MVVIQLWWGFWCGPYVKKINVKSHLTETVPGNSIGFIFVLYISVLIKLLQVCMTIAVLLFFLGLLVTVSLKALISSVVVQEAIV